MALVTAGAALEGIIDTVAVEGVAASDGLMITEAEANMSQYRGFKSWWDRLKSNPAFQQWMQDRVNDVLESLKNLGRDTAHDVEDILNQWWNTRHERRMGRRRFIRNRVQDGDSLLEAWRQWFRSPEREGLYHTTFTDALAERTYAHLREKARHPDTHAGIHRQIADGVVITSLGTVQPVGEAGNMAVDAVHPERLRIVDDDGPPRKRVRIDPEASSSRKRRRDDSDADARREARRKRAKKAQDAWKKKHSDANANNRMPRRKYTGYKGPESIQHKELKYRDTAQGTSNAFLTSPGTSGTLDGNQFHLYHLNIIAQGNTEHNRVGRHCQLTRVAVHLQVQNVDTDTEPKALVAMLIWDHHPRGTTPSVTDFFESTHFLAFNNLDNRKRFTVLATRKITFGHRDGSAGLVTSADKQNHVIKMYRSIKKGGVYMTEYNGTTGVIGETVNGALYLVLRSDCTADNTLAYNFQARVRFEDPS
jgi:hypothetical protein